MRQVMAARNVVSRLDMRDPISAERHARKGNRASRTSSITRLRDRQLHRRLFLRLGLVVLEAGAATRLVRRVADFDLRVAAGDALRVVRGAAAAHAHRVHLRHFLGHREQRGHRAERPALEILIESGGDDADAGVGELHADVDDSGVEELHFVDADDLHADLDARQQLRARGDGQRFQPPVIARHDFVGCEAIVDDRLEDLNALPRDDRAAQPADQLFRLSGEHASGDDFDPAATMNIQ